MQSKYLPYFTAEQSSDVQAEHAPIDAAQLTAYGSSEWRSVIESICYTQWEPFISPKLTAEQSSDVQAEHASIGAAQFTTYGSSEWCSVIESICCAQWEPFISPKLTA